MLRLEVMSCAEVESTIQGKGCSAGHKILGVGRRLECPGHEGREVAAMGRGDPALDRIEMQHVRLILEPFGHRGMY